MYHAIMSNDELYDRIREAVQKLPERDSIARVRLFGSRLTGNPRPDSDVDLIVDFSPMVGLLALVGIQQQLEHELGLRVDLLTPRSISKYIREDVLQSAKTVYEKR